jgi:uncharacterized protein YlxP (DUF503 family)
MMHVGVCRFTLVIPASHSLKDKRAVVRRVKDRIGQRFKVVLSEVGGQDTWQRAELAFSVLTGARDAAQAAVNGVLAFVAAQGLGELTLERHEVLAFGDDWYAEARPMAAARVEGEADASWLPAAWLAGDDGGNDPEGD